jgi:hypothetical protein
VVVGLEQQGPVLLEALVELVAVVMAGQVEIVGLTELPILAVVVVVEVTQQVKLEATAALA